jgi:glycolate oxidase FAD binding subunit
MANDFSLDGFAPQHILSPRDASELAQMLAQCNTEGCAVVPWGGGTLQHLGNSPARYDAVLQTALLNHVVEYAFDDLTATFGAGMTLAGIDRVLGEQGQFLPLDVPHPERATIGGVLAAGANGPLRLRYGSARDYMLGNRFATVDGKIIKAGSKVVKNVAGYELHKVQVGAFGTLGILTEATFKLFPKPPAEMTVHATFENVGDACAAVPEIWNLATPPLAIELLNADAAQLAAPALAGAWHVIARFGGSPATMTAARDLCILTVTQGGARSAVPVEQPATLWRALADLPADLRGGAADGLLVRASIPPAELYPAIQALDELAQIHQLPPPRLCAHAAVAVIYAAFNGADAALYALVPQLRARLHALRGHLVVENGSPALKARVGVWDDVGASLKLMQSLKRKFDPNNILNPGRFVGGI